MQTAGNEPAKDAPPHRLQQYLCFEVGLQLARERLQDRLGNAPVRDRIRMRI